MLALRESGFNLSSSIAFHGIRSLMHTLSIILCTTVYAVAGGCDELCEAGRITCLYLLAQDFLHACCQMGRCSYTRTLSGVEQHAKDTCFARGMK